MPTFIELEQLLDIALTTPEMGTVNFNILRVFLQEILQHLNIVNKPIDIDAIAGELKSAYDFVKDGYVEVSGQGKRSPEVTQDRRTPETIERPKTGSRSKSQSIAGTEQEEELIVNAEQSEDAQSKSELPILTIESKSDDSVAGKGLTPTPPKSAVLPVKDQFSPSPPRSGGLSVKDQPPTNRSSVFLLGRTDSLKNLKKMVSELQERVEFLESQPPPAPAPDPVRSAASLVRKESKTPAHDFVELVNIRRKLEASENSLEGLTEMVDALASDLNELKESLPNMHNISSDLRSDVEELRKSLETTKEEKAGKQEVHVEEISKQTDTDHEQRIDGIESTLTSLQEAMVEMSNRVDNAPSEKVTDVVQVTDPKVQETLDDHEKQLQRLEAQIQEIEGKIEGTSTKSSGAEQAAADALTRLEVCGEGITDIKNKQETLGKELKNHQSLIEDNEMQIHQLRNTMSLLKRESLDRVNEESAEKKTEEEKEPESETPTPRRRAYSVDREELSLIRTMIFDLQEEKDKLKQTDIRLSDELYRKQRHLDDLYNMVDELRDLKVDKEILSMGFELKADKKDMEAKIGREDFEHYMSLVDQSLRDLLQRLDGHEDALKGAIEAIHTDVGKKLDKEEVEPLKHYLEARMESIKPKPVERPPPDEFAAGIRKQFLVNHNCISCDRPVKYAREEAFPPLPTMHSMPGSKSNRPYTTFELEQIRQHMLQGGLLMTKERFELLEKQRSKLQKEILRLSGVRDLQELAEVTARACGGVHTLTYPHSQSVVRGLQLNRDDLDFLVPQKDFQPVDILGQDGHIYKGLLEALPPTLPHIPQKSKSPGVKNPPRNLRRSTTPTSPNLQKPTADQVESC